MKVYLHNLGRDVEIMADELPNLVHQGLVAEVAAERALQAEALKAEAALKEAKAKAEAEEARAVAELKKLAEAANPVPTGNAKKDAN
jgi:uncharacterized membrane protein YqiK